jgi:hypothetical protein
MLDISISASADSVISRAAFTIPPLPAWSTCFLSEPLVGPWTFFPIKGRSLSRRDGEPASRPVYGRGVAATPVRAMELITILNRCHRFRGYVYQHAYISADKKSIEVAAPTAQGFGRRLLALPFAGARLRSARRTAL